MRIPIIAILAALGSMSAAQAANDQPWCYRDFSGRQYTNCSFPTARHCLAIAGVMGGVCERNQMVVGAPSAPTKGKRAQR
ncbi:DUF3551 domain-containing protein [Microbacteriaceae bacterium K1510]|nr:DUF3551 domain-containing protein [Microbacteriaceae bacterium K1510]